MALSHDGLVVAVASGNTIEFFSSTSGSLLYRITDAHLHGETINSIHFDNESRYLASAGRDRQVRLWRNAPGLQEKARDGGEKEYATRKGSGSLELMEGSALGDNSNFRFIDPRVAGAAATRYHDRWQREHPDTGGRSYQSFGRTGHCLFLNRTWALPVRKRIFFLSLLSISI